MNYNIIETGSTGNATVIENCILIDCGIAYKKLKPFVKDLNLVLLTHIHSDHLNKSTIKKLASERPTLRFGCGEWLVQELLNCGVKIENIDLYKPGKIYNYNDIIKIKIELTTHDVPNCCYFIKINNKQVFYATDTCTLDGIEAKDYDLYLVEANYLDDNELENRIKQHQEKGEFSYESRVKKTHLSQVKAWEWLLENKKEDSIYVFMHEHVEKEKE